MRKEKWKMMWRLGRGQVTLDGNMAFKLGPERQGKAEQPRKQSTAGRGTASAKAQRWEQVWSATGTRINLMTMEGTPK